jgi:uncharacterized protein (DUF885 family)
MMCFQEKLLWTIQKTIIFTNTKLFQMRTTLKIGVIALTILLFNACSKDIEITPELIKNESTRVREFLEARFQAELERSPEFQTHLGIKDDTDKWSDISPEHENAVLEGNRIALNWMIDSIIPEALDTPTKLSFDLYKQKLENSIDDYKFRLYDYPINQMFGIQSELPALLINSHQVKTVKDAEDYIARLTGMKSLFEQLVKNLKERQVAGIVPPKFVFEHVLNDCSNILKGQPFDDSSEHSALLSDISDKIENLKIGDRKKDELYGAAVDAMLDGVLPAYELLIETLKEQQKVATSDAGIWKFPNAKAYYSMKLKRTTTTDLTSEEIHQIGLNEVARIHKEMNVIKGNVGFEGTLQDFFEFMKTDKQFYYPATQKGRDAYLAKAFAIIDSMKTRLDELFIVKPKADIFVKAVEAFREKSAGKAFYQQPAADGSRPGIYYANLYDMEAMPTYQMEALAYHEGIPGHHMQLAIQQELEGIPNFRKFGGYSAYMEGWGLYSEYLPKELGFYSDPYSDFGRLAMELWRACRLVVDTGIHAQKWTRKEGIKYYTDNTPNVESDAVKMVERHIVMPGQATAYKIGMLKILELRAAAKEMLGAEFDIRKFHEVVLLNGALPLNVLEDLVNEWVASAVSTELKGL